jgi:PAS domain S-box-containing protein
MEQATSSDLKDNRFQLICENLGDLVWSVDMDLRFNYISPNIKDILGFTQDELKEKTLQDILDRESFLNFKQNILWEKSLTNDGWHVMELELKKKDGSTISSGVKLSLIKDDKSGFFEILGACRINPPKSLRTDIMEKALNEWEKTFDAVTDIVAVISPEFEILRLNQKGYEVTRLKPVDIIGKKCYEIMHNSEEPIPECPCKKTIETKKAQEGEFSQNGKYYMATASPIFNEKDELIAFAHTVRDITRRKKIEEAIKESEEKFRNIVSQSSDGITLLDENGMVWEWNRANEKITGLKKKDVLGKPFWEIQYLSLPTEKKTQEMKEHFKKAIQGFYQGSESPWLNKYLDVKIQRPDGSLRQIQSHVFSYETSKGLSLGAISRDVTETRDHELAISESEEKYRQLFEKMLDGFSYHKIVVDEDNKPIDYIFLEVNSEFEELTGLKRENIIGKKVTSVIPGIEDDPAHWIDIYGAVALEGKEFRFEQFAEPLGKWYSVSTYCPKKGYFATVFEDITERKLTEEALQTTVESTMGTIGQEFFDKIVNTLCRWLQADCAIIGEIINENEIKSISMLLDGKRIEDYRYKSNGTPCEEVAEKGYSEFPENVTSTFPNDKVLAELKAQGYVGVALRNTQGDPIGILCMISRKKMRLPTKTRDVMGIVAAKASAELERIQAESNLTESEERFRTLFDRAGEALFLIEIQEGRFIDVNERACDALGYSKDELLNLTVSDVNPIFPKEKFREFVDALKRDKPVTVEAVHKRKDGSNFPVEIRTGFIDIHKKPHMLSLARDITLRKQGEEKLQWELNVNKALADLSNALISPTAKIEEIGEIVLAYSQTLTNSEHGYVSFIDPETGDNVAHTLTRMMTSCLIEGENKRSSFPKGPDGMYSGLWGFALNSKKSFYTNSPRSHESSKGVPPGHIQLDNFLSVPAVIAGELVGQIALANSAHGFTDRHLAAIKQIAHLYSLVVYRLRSEVALRESEEKFRELAELLPETIFLSDENGMLTFVNQAGLKAFGYSQEDIDSGFNVLQALTPQDRERGLENIAKLFTNDKTPGTEYLAQRKDGNTFPVVIYANSVLRDGKPAGLRGIVLDITSRKQAEEQIQRALSEKKLLFSELKHRVNNNLQLLMSMVNMWTMESESEEAKDALHEVEGLISAMALVHSEAQLDGTAKKIQLKKFMTELANGIIKIRSHRNLEITHSVNGDEVWLDIDQANPVSLIANELLLNALKHAFNGREQGHIEVSILDKDNTVNLSVRDNGVGISKDVDLNKPDSLGLDLINNMVEQLNGKINIIVENGTNIEIEFPKGGAQNGEQ